MSISGRNGRSAGRFIGPALLIGLAALGCSREPDPEVLPKGKGWMCSLDECERECTERLRRTPPPCEPRAAAFCLTWVDGASDRPLYYCATSPVNCEQIQRAHENGKLGERPARRVSLCREVR
jgi:hypothetical protein